MIEWRDDEHWFEKFASERPRTRRERIVDFILVYVFMIFFLSLFGTSIILAFAYYYR